MHYFYRQQARGIPQPFDTPTVIAHSHSGWTKVRALLCLSFAMASEAGLRWQTFGMQPVFSFQRTSNSGWLERVEHFANISSRSLFRAVFARSSTLLSYTLSFKWLILHKLQLPTPLSHCVHCSNTVHKLVLLTSQSRCVRWSLSPSWLPSESPPVQCVSCRTCLLLSHRHQRNSKNHPCVSNGHWLRLPTVLHRFGGRCLCPMCPVFQSPMSRVHVPCRVNMFKEHGTLE